MSQHRRVLVVEDDPDIAHVVGVNLKDLGCDVLVGRDGAEALKLLGTHAIDLIVLDLTLPRVDGLEVCQQVRRRSEYTPILMLTARSEELDRVLGLELGADDYLTKPFSVRELQARVKALFRRAESLAVPCSSGAGEVIRAGVFVIDAAAHTVTLRGMGVNVTGKEFDLLAELARDPGRTYTRADLLHLVWGYAHDTGAHTVNSHINRLRAKIEQDPSRPRHILTVRGVGYRFTGTPDEAS